MKLSLAYSTCPNDTYIFAAVDQKKIDLQGIDFDISMADIDVLNTNATQKNAPDITKISANAYADKLWKDYVILNSGSALGFANGPVLVAKNYFDVEELNSKKILIPGINTTANMLLSIFFPDAKNKTPMLFSEIENQVLNGNYDCGLLIHEGRFTYQSRGLKKIVDFGELWEQHTKMPIPLGFIIAKRTLPLEIIATVDNIIKRSIDYARTNTADIMPFIRNYAQEMNNDVMLNHIKLYVNNFTYNLGNDGRAAAEYFFKRAYQSNLLTQLPEKVFY